MKRRTVGLLFACLLMFAGVFSGCSKNLSSELYWNGAEKEAKWVKKNVKHLQTPAQDETLNAAQNNYAKPVQPELKDGSRKYRVGIVISGDYWEFLDNYKALVEGFSNIGWAHSVQIPASLATCSQVISYLSRQDYSEYVEFPEEYFVNMDWGSEKAVAELNRLYFGKNKPDVDAIIAYGGMASKIFYQNEQYAVPVLADAITDPFGAGVAKSLEDSGRDFFSCKIDPDIYKQQVRLFARTTDLKTIGIVYGDDDYGRIYSAVGDVEQIAAEEGFEIIRNTNVIEDITDDTVSLYLAALKDVAARADAVYIGASTAVTEYDIMDEIVAILDEAKKPSFSLEGSIRVKDGILYSLASSGMTSSGIYTATKLSHIFSGVKPRSLPQKFENVPSIALNLYTAQKIGYQVPMDILISSDEIYVDRAGTVKHSFAGSETAVAGLSDFANVIGTKAVKYAPHLNAEGLKYKVGIIQSGSYWEFTEHFKGMLSGLQQDGWIDANIAIPAKPKSIEELLAALGDRYSDYLVFDQNWNINLDWDGNSKQIEKIKAVKESQLDLFISFGAMAGNIFTRYKNFPVPVLIEAVNDPVAAGISYSQKDSGRDFITCRIDPLQYQRQIQLFHNTIGFKKLGIIYGDDEYGRLYSAVNDVEVVALKKGFEIIRNTRVKEEMAADTKRLYLAALEDICKKADAVYIGASTAVTEYDIMDDIVAILNKYKIPSFSLEGEIRVKDGVLMGVSALETEKIGLYNADKIAAILSGQTPRSLEQIYTGMPSIVFNMKTAENIGLDISLEVLSSIDSLYW